MKITDKQKDCMLHALGHPKIRKNWKARTILYKCYRNRYVVDKERDYLEDLVEKGFMGVVKRQDMFFYFVTEKGVEHLKKNIGGEKHND